ncbi:unnamed protein product, partial [Scytosiphon promiscuus]
QQRTTSTGESVSGAQSLSPSPSLSPSLSPSPPSSSASTTLAPPSDALPPKKPRAIGGGALNPALSRMAEAAAATAAASAVPPRLIVPGDAGMTSESNRAAAAAVAGVGSSGGRRRAKIPSRKLLEACGKVADEGVQLLTKEKKEEENRLKMEMREQRRAAKTAGLRLGEVIEATVAGPLSSSGASGREVGSGGGSRSWESDRSGGNAFGVGGEAAASPSSLSWWKLSPAEILQAAQHQQ